MRVIDQQHDIQSWFCIIVIITTIQGSKVSVIFLRVGGEKIMLAM